MSLRHIVIENVSCFREPPAGGPGNAYRFDAPEEHHERQEVLAAQHFIKEMCVPDTEAHVWK